MSILKQSFIYICVAMAVLILWIIKINRQPNELSTLRHYFNCDFKVVIPIAVRFNNENFILPDLIQAAQMQINEELRALDVQHLGLVLVDDLHVGNVSQGYMMDLILHHENSLGISSDSLQVAIFYTLESIHSNDLPFFLAQTVLYHFLNGEVDLFSRPESEDFENELEFEIGFGQAVNKTRTLDVLRTIEKLATAVKYITLLRWTINNKLVSGKDEVVINFPGRLSKTMKGDSNTAFKIQTILEDQLQLPLRPRNNLLVRLLASYRKKTVSNIKQLLDKLDEGKESGKLINQLTRLVADVGQSQNISWLGYLERSQDMLLKLNEAMYGSSERGMA